MPQESRGLARTVAELRYGFSAGQSCAWLTSSAVVRLRGRDYIWRSQCDGRGTRKSREGILRECFGRCASGVPRHIRRLLKRLLCVELQRLFGVFAVVGTSLRMSCSTD